MKFAIATEDFPMISVDWNENNTYIQSALLCLIWAFSQIPISFLSIIHSIGVK